MNSLLLISAENLKLGFQVLLLGMLAVFGVLFAIWLTLTVFKSVFGISSVKAKTEHVAHAVTETSSPVAISSTNEEIVAVLAAAIAMAESENSTLKFRVVSFRRKQ